jgi:8-oxo-dGTP diphosphatase
MKSRDINYANLRLDMRRRKVIKNNEALAKIEVVAGILKNNGQILCLQRGKGKYDYISYKYEFPGGKLELGESPATALQRELSEEMNIDINVSESDFYMTTSHIYPDFALTMHCFICNLETRQFEMIEHIDFKWLIPAQMYQLDWAEADKPIINQLMEDKSL